MKRKAPMSRYKSRFEGVPAAVLGGGPSLIADFAKVPHNAILIAVNFHAFNICKPDFVVYNDDPKDNEEMRQLVTTTKAIKVSPDPTSDVIFDVDVWTGFYSSNTAAWFALWMGCDPVILCGMDCYQGEVKYAFPCSIKSGVLYWPLDMHIRPWIEDAKNLLPNVERVRAASGPLVPVFGEYR